MRLQLGLQMYQVPSAQEALKQRVVRPLAVSQEHFVDFRAPFVIGNIIGNDIARGLVGAVVRSSHRFLT